MKTLVLEPAPGGCMCHLFDEPRPRTCSFMLNWDAPWPDTPAWFCWVRRCDE